MKVDVLLICYNQEQFIGQAVESILLQRVKEDVEVRVIVADDCSMDDTLEIIRKCDQKQCDTLQSIGINREQAIDMRMVMPFVYLDTNQNLGISKNYCRAFSASDADYIAVLEGDDYWSSPYHLEQHIRFLDKHRECSMSMNTITRMNQERHEFLAPTWFGNDEVRYVDTKCQISEGNQLGNLSACVFRNSCLQALPLSLYELSIADWMLGVMLSQQGLIAILKESTSVYRTNENSKWASMTSSQQKQNMYEGSIAYDNFQGGLYHAYWEAFRSKLNYKITYKDYLPPVVFPLLKWFKKKSKILCPPIVWKLLKRLFK